MKEQIVTGKKFRILTDATSRLWHVISFWTKAQDVEFNDGINAQIKLGNVVGISDSLTSTSSNIAASAAAVKALNDKIVNQIDNLTGQLNNAQNGFDIIYNAIVAQGVTPAGKTPAQLTAGIAAVATSKYNAGNSAGYTSGYNAGKAAGGTVSCHLSAEFDGYAGSEDDNQPIVRATVTLTLPDGRTSTQSLTHCPGQYMYGDQDKTHFA